MKAVVYTRYGPPAVLRLADVDTPVPKGDEVLVKIHAVSLNGSDWETLRGKPLYSRIGGRNGPPMREYSGFPRSVSQSDPLRDTARTLTSTSSPFGTGVSTSVSRSTPGGPYRV